MSWEVEMGDSNADPAMRTWRASTSRLKCSTTAASGPPCAFAAFRLDGWTTLATLPREGPGDPLMPGPGCSI